MVEIQHNRELDSLYVGLEDVKLMYYRDNMHYICNRGINANKIEVESGIIDKNGVCSQSNMLKLEQQNSIEKNWVLFHHKSEDALHFVYNWYPLQLGKMLDDSENDTTRTYNTFIYERHDTPRLFSQVRGSTNGVYIDNECWFLCHMVSYENIRFYYHLFVVLDPTNNYKLKKYSKLFTFDKCPVEYTTGFVYDEYKKQLLIGYSNNDNITKFVNIDKKHVDNLFI
jgi:hypothetical protein